jgi:hypothetical protein
LGGGPGRGAEASREEGRENEGRPGGGVEAGQEEGGCGGGAHLGGGPGRDGDALSMHAMSLPRGCARSFACGRGYEAVSHGKP